MKKIFLLFNLAILLGGCSADIDPSASNSISAVIAVLGEYTLAILRLYLFYILRFITILSGVFIYLGTIHIIENSTVFNINPSYLLFTGIILMLAGLLQPNATYNPQIAIARNSWKRKNSPTDKKNNSFSEILVQIISGIMVGFILHICGI